MLQQITTRFLRYNLWANQRLTAWLLTINRKILYTETPSSFRTIDHTLQHIVAAQQYWYTLLIEGKINEFNQPFKENVINEVIAKVIASSQLLVNQLSIMSEDQLSERIQASDSTQSRYEYILHVVNHSSYHRGQIITLCRHLGISEEIPTTDYDAYLWWIENEEKE